MKRIFTFGLMLASALALTNCTEELVDTTVPTDQVVEEQVTGVPFQIQATLGVDTKTAGDFVGGKLKTKWKENDKINVLFAEVQNGAVGELKDAGLFTVTDTENGIFEGFLPNEGIEDSKTYNWYFVYDASGATFAKDKTTATITIGSVEQKQSTTTGNNTDTDVEHIGAASNCPMWGRATNISGTITPIVQMKHLASLYEVTIENRTSDNEYLAISAGDIVIYDLGMSVSTTGTWISEDNGQQQALVGDFQLNILTGTLEKQVGNNSYSLKLNLTDETNLEFGQSAKYYFVAAPLEIQTNKTSDSRFYELISNPSTVKTADEYNKLSDKQKKLYQAVTKRQDTFTFKVNGAERNVPASKVYDMKSGSLYRFTLPIKSLSYPHESDAFNVTSQGRETDDDTHLVEDVITTNATPITVNVNGQDVNAFLLETKNADNLGSITITGFAPDLISAIPIGFYTSAWNNEPSVVNVSQIDVLFPKYSTTAVKSDNQSNLGGLGGIGRTRYDVTTDYSKILSRGTIPMVLNIGSTSSVWDINLSIDPQMLSSIAEGIVSKTTFSGMPKQGRFDDDKSDGVNHNVVVMNQEYSYKQINSKNLNTFLQTFGATASYEGFVQILTAPISALPTETVAEEIWNMQGKAVSSVQKDITWPTKKLSTDYPELVETVDAIYSKLSSYSMTMDLGTTVAIDLVGEQGFIKNKIQLIHVLRDAKIAAKLSTTTDGPRLVFWGLDAKGADVKVPARGDSE